MNLDSIGAARSRRGARDAIAEGRAAFERLSDWQTAALLAAAAALIFWQYGLPTAPLAGDTSFQVYAGQQMLIGHPIYRDVGIIKTPLSAMIAALAMALLRPFGIEDVIAVRLVCFLAALALVAVTYLFASKVFNRRAIGVLASLAMIGYNFVGRSAVGGPEPKVFLMLFGLAALWLVQQRRYGWAGLCAGLAFLSWQPGLIFVALVGAVALAETGGARLRSMVRGVLGALAPVALVALYLALSGALLSGWNSTIGANLVHFERGAGSTPLTATLWRNSLHIFNLTTGACFKFDLPALGLGFLGLMGFSVGTIWQAVRHGWRSVLSIGPFLVYNLALGAFSLIDFQGCPDFFPTLPAITIGLGWLLVSLGDGVARASRRLVPERNTRFLLAVIFSLILTVIGVLHAMRDRNPVISLPAQERIAAEIAGELGPDDRMLQLGHAFALVMEKRTSASKVLMLGSKSGYGVLAMEPGGADGWVAALDQNPPRIITITRDPEEPWEAGFVEWRDQNYTLYRTLPFGGETLYVYRLKDRALDRRPAGTD